MSTNQVKERDVWVCLTVTGRLLFPGGAEKHEFSIIRILKKRFLMIFVHILVTNAVNKGQIGCGWVITCHFVGYIFVNRPACGLNWGHCGRGLGWCNKVTPFPFCGSSLVIWWGSAASVKRPQNTVSLGEAVASRACRAGDDSTCQNWFSSNLKKFSSLLRRRGLVYQKEEEIQLAVPRFVYLHRFPIYVFVTLAKFLLKLECFSHITTRDLVFRVMVLSCKL